METIWLEAINKYGVIALLILNVGLMLRGDVFSKAAVNKMLQVGDKRAEIMAKEIAKAMQDGIEKSVEAGILKAVAEIREMAHVTPKLRKAIKTKKQIEEPKSE